MSLPRTLIKNVCANWFGFAVQILVTFLLTPFVLGALGDARYGLWALLMGMTGYYGLLDLGFRAGLTQFITRYLARREYSQLNQTASTGFVCLTLLGVVVAVISVALAFIAPTAFDVPEESVEEVRWSIILIGASLSLQFPFFTFSAVITAAQRYDLSNAIGISTRIVSASATYLLLKGGYGLVGIAAATLIANLLDYFLRFCTAFLLTPELSIRPQAVRLQSFWEFASFGLWNILIAGSRQLISYTDALVIGLFLPTAAIAPFALAASLVQYFNRFIIPATSVFFPAATHLDARGDMEGLRRVYHVASRVILSLAITAGLIAGFWCNEFFDLWVGSGSKNSYGSAPELFRLLILAAVLTSGQRIGYQILLGTKRVRVLALLLAAEGLTNFLLSIALINPFGLRGVAMSTLLPAIAFQAIIHPLVVSRVLNVSYRQTLARIYLRPFIYAGGLAITLFVLKTNLPHPNGWFGLVAHGLAASTSAICLLPAIVLTHSERSKYIICPCQNGLGRIGYSRHRTTALPSSDSVVKAAQERI